MGEIINIYIRYRSKLQVNFNNIKYYKFEKFRAKKFQQLWIGGEVTLKKLLLAGIEAQLISSLFSLSLSLH